MGSSTEVSQPPHGIMDLQDPGIPWRRYIVFAILAILLIFALAQVWLWWKRRKEARTLHSSLPSGKLAIDPWQHIQVTYSSLIVGTNWSRETSEAYYFALSFLLRQAMELRTRLPLTSQTLSELRKTLDHSQAFSANFKTELLEFLTLAEQLKFAGRWLDVAESEAWRTRVGVWLSQLERGDL